MRLVVFFASAEGASTLLLAFLALFFVVFFAAAFGLSAVACASAFSLGGPAGRAAARRRVRGAALRVWPVASGPLVSVVLVSVVGSLSSIRVTPVNPGIVPRVKS